MTMPDGPEAVAGVSVGEIIGNKYRVERVLGAGGMGVVVAARHVELEERVAIKLLLPHMLTDPAAVGRFYREAKAAARIKGEHVARVFDVDRLPNGAPYMVMEFLEGTDLSGWLAQQGTLPSQQAVDFIVQACVAVADAHALGIVHRDLKPANLFCLRRSDGQLCIKVLDFGISKISESNNAGMSFTQTSAVMGSPLYMSPEQFRSSKNVDGRTDIWALGGILFELLTGQPPFSAAASVTELAIKIAMEPAPSAQALRPDLPPGLAAVIARCLEKDPERRYPTVADLALALAPFAPQGAQASVRRIAGIIGRHDGQEPLAPSWSPAVSSQQAKTGPGLEWTTPGPAPKRKTALLAGAAGALALIAGVAWWGAHGLSTAYPLQEKLIASATPAASPSAALQAAPGELSTDRAPADSAAHETSPTPPTSTLDAAPAVSASPPSPVSSSPNQLSKIKPPRSGAKGKTGANSTSGTTAAKPARVNCDPPFFFDASGNRVFKQECL